MSRYLAITLLICILSCMLVSGGIISTNRKRSNHMEDKVHDIFRPKVVYAEPNKISAISSITATVFGYKYQIKLVLNRQLVPDNFQHTYQNQEGNIERYEGAEHCHYQGRVFYITPTNQSIALNSEVIVSACQGFKGMIMIDSQVYIVEPMNPTNSLEGDHIIYEEKEFGELEYPNPLLEISGNEQDEEPEQNHENENNGEHGEEESEEHDPEHENEHDEEGEEEEEREHRRNRRQAKTKYIELVVVNDKKFVEKMNGDLKAVENHVIQVVNLVDAMYKTINVRVTLVGMVTWNVKDEIIVSTNSRLTLESLSTYRFNDVMKAIPNDNVQLMTGVIFNDGAGRAWQSTMCKFYSTGANYAFANIARAAAFMARNLGHNLGMRADIKKKCTCVKIPGMSSNGCIMSSHIYGPPAMSFSSCSVKDLRKAFQQGIGRCLSNVPENPRPATTDKPTIMTTQSQVTTVRATPSTMPHEIQTTEQTEQPTTPPVATTTNKPVMTTQSQVTTVRATPSTMPREIQTTKPTEQPTTPPVIVEETEATKEKVSQATPSSEPMQEGIQENPESMTQ